MKTSDEFRASVIKALEDLLDEAKTIDFDCVGQLSRYEDSVDMFSAFIHGREIELNEADYAAFDSMIANEQK